MFGLVQWFSTGIVLSVGGIRNLGGIFSYFDNWGELVAPGGGQGSYMTCYSQDSPTQ